MKSGTRERNHLESVALVSLLVLVGGTLLYPDTFTSAGIHLASLRLGVLALLFIVTAPQVLACVWINRNRLNPGVLDTALVVTLAYFLLRGLIAAREPNIVGLTGAYFLYALLLFYGFAIVVQRGVSRRVVAVTLALIAFAISLYAIVEFFVGENFVFMELIKDKITLPSRAYHRSGSALGHPVALGIFLVQAAPLAVFLYAKAKDYRARIFWLAAAIAAALALEATLTKGSWIPAASLGVLAACWYLRRQPASRRTVLVLILSVTAAAALFTAASYRNIYDGIFSQNRQTESIAFRQYMWSTSPDVIRNNLFFGVGMWEGGSAVAGVDSEAVAGRGIQHPTIDNTYISLLVEEGVTGFFLMMITILLIGFEVWRLARSKIATKSDLYIPLAFGAAALLINGMTADTLLIWPAMVLFWSYAGMLHGMALVNRRGEKLLFEAGASA